MIVGGKIEICQACNKTINVQRVFDNSDGYVYLCEDCIEIYKKFGCNY